MSLRNPALQGLSVFERGWLSSNNVLIHERGGGATLIDSGHSAHAEQTVALVRSALQPSGQGLARIVNTHLHSDHCGGNAALQREFGARVSIPPGLWQAALRWDEQALGYAPIGQRCERFEPQERIVPGEPLHLGGRRWEVLPSPGHDPHSVILFDAGQGVLISADALWENGYGVVFPELGEERPQADDLSRPPPRGYEETSGGRAFPHEPGFDDVQAVLDLIASLPVQYVIPGHGAPFADCAGALHRARALLAKQRANPAGHGRHATKVLIKYRLMEEREQSWDALCAWAIERPMLESAFRQQPQGAGSSMREWCEQLVLELVQRGALALRDGVVRDVA